jgi:hypothetical protein
MEIKWLPLQAVEKVRQVRSRCLEVSTYSLVRLGLLTPCGLSFDSLRTGQDGPFSTVC